jgi:4-hydroxythreonine-4-phosphate dehydrogenase
MTGWIGISLGDITGIGPEVTLKALAHEIEADSTRYLLIGDSAHVRALDRRLGLNLPLEPYAGNPTSSGRMFLHQPLPAALPEGEQTGSPVVARAAVEWVRDGAQRCLKGETDALVTAPVNKEAIVRAGVAFIGQTELLSQCARADRTAMMLLGEDERGRWLRVALATTHVPLKDVSAHLTIEKILLVIELAAGACRDLGLRRARVAVCGLNPHAGEGGHMGAEEQTIIGPAVEQARLGGIDVLGPLSADALFYHAYRGEYDAVVAMYHDQGLAPLKMVTFETGVNWTLGLPFIRTSSAPPRTTAQLTTSPARARPIPRACRLPSAWRNNWRGRKAESKKLKAEIGSRDAAAA